MMARLRRYWPVIAAIIAGIARVTSGHAMMPQAEIDAFEQAVNAFARKFKLAGAEVVVPFDVRERATPN
jgi:hypothetical protein